jgi:glucan biosynthesis protein C
VGIFTHAALQVYLERITHGQFRGSFFAFLPHYFDGLYAFGGNFAWMGLHLWYLLILFAFSLICLPLLLWLKRGSGARLLNKLGRFLARPAAIYLPALPIILLLISLDPAEPLGARPWGGWSLVPHLLFFLYGFLFVSHSGLQRSIRRLRWISLSAGLILFVAYLLLKTIGGDPAFGTPRYSLVFSLYGLSSWCWILAIWGFGMQHLNFSTPFLKYANQAVLPFYVMHQTVLLVVGYFVVGWAIPDLLKLGVISLSSLVIIVVGYEFLVRRSNLLRVLFGMRALRHAPQLTSPSPLPQTTKT